MSKKCTVSTEVSVSNLTRLFRFLPQLLEKPSEYFIMLFLLTAQVATFVF